MIAAARALPDVFVAVFTLGVLAGVAGTRAWLFMNSPRREVDARPVRTSNLPAGRAASVLRIIPRPYDHEREDQEIS